MTHFRVQEEYLLTVKHWEPWRLQVSQRQTLVHWKQYSEPLSGETLVLLFFINRAVWTTEESQLCFSWQREEAAANSAPDVCDPQPLCLREKERGWARNRSWMRVSLSGCGVCKAGVRVLCERHLSVVYSKGGGLNMRGCVCGLRRWRMCWPSYTHFCLCLVSCLLVFKGLPEAVTHSARETDALKTQDKCFLGKMQIFFQLKTFYSSFYSEWLLFLITLFSMMLIICFKVQTVILENYTKKQFLAFLYTCRLDIIQVSQLFCRMT